MLTARDIMTKEVVTVTPQTGVRELAALLLARNISGAPVWTRPVRCWAW